MGVTRTQSIGGTGYAELNPTVVFDLWFGYLGVSPTPQRSVGVMRAKNRKGFTLIELLIVVVIIGILAAIAIPKFAATKDKAKLASVKTDIRNIMTAEEAYFSDYATYTATVPTTLFTPSSGNTYGGSASTSSWTATVTNSSISVAPNQCTVTVGSGTTTDGVITCS
jgi:prepilin-type N-terminal cleavage/methylation domain-containing protein